METALLKIISFRALAVNNFFQTLKHQYSTIFETLQGMNNVRTSVVMFRGYWVKGPYFCVKNGL